MRFIIKGRILLIMAAIISCAAFLWIESAAADDGTTTITVTEGAGNSTGGRKTSCQKFVHGFQLLCGDNGSGGGGRSWRVYSTSTYSGPNPNGGSILQGGINKQNIMQTCPAGEYEWYVAHGWEGPRLSQQFGPAQFQGSGAGLIANAVYNSYNSISGEDAVNQIITGTIGDGVRLNGDGAMWTLLGAMSRYQQTSLKADTGYFCIKRAAFVPNGSEDSGEGDGGCVGAECNDNPPTVEEPDCSSAEWKPASYASSDSNGGTTSIVEGIANNRLLKEGWGEWNKWKIGTDNGTSNPVFIYAMPTDTVSWKTCYYPGVQKTASTKVSKTSNYDGHAGHGDVGCNSGGSNSNATVAMSSKSAFGYDWENQYQFRHDGTSSSGSELPYQLPNNGSLFKHEIGDGDIKEVFNQQKIASINDAGQYSKQSVTSSGKPWTASVSELERAGYSWSCCRHSCSCGINCTTTCTSTCRHSNAYKKGEATIKEISASAEVRIPWNYVNVAGVGISDDYQDRIYSGEEVKIDVAWVNTVVKWNELTEYAYATQVDGARMELVTYITTTDEGAEEISADAGCDFTGGKQCAVVETWDGTLNNGGTMEELLYGSERQMDGTNTMTDMKKVYKAFDASAGDYMCFRMAVYPATSGDDGNYTDQEGNHMWYFSPPSCAPIAKRPSFQVYGGSLYSGGAKNSMITSESRKQNLWGLYDYDSGYQHSPGGDDILNNTIIFGSWVEQGVVANGGVKGLASGASLGYYDDEVKNRARSGQLGLGNFCEYRAPLSFANYSSQSIVKGICDSVEVIGGANIQSNAVGGQVDKSALVDYWAAGAPAEANFAGGSTGLNDNCTALDSASGAKIWFTRSSEDITLRGGEIDAGVTRIIVARDDNGVPKDVTINGNIMYQNVKGNTYNNGSQVPQVVIYGNNIKINCDVTTIDAVLIAEGTVNTCKDAKNGGEDDNTNSELRSHQLNIRGMVIANKLELNRTYGTAWGKQSNIPAETINYDTSTMLWGRYMAGSGESDILTTVYQHEIAPRY